MKIEAAESLFLSWLRHVKECQLVQTNWKSSPQWERKNEGILERLMLSSKEFFKSNGDYDIYKGTKEIGQLLRQAEIDILGIKFDESKEGKIYAIDVAFHESGLNYGTREETIARVIKKLLRTVMCIVGYFDFCEAEIIFASPKINPNIAKEINNIINYINDILGKENLDYKIRIIANHDIKEHILSPLLSVLNNVADTSELFMRSLQLYMLMEGTKSSISSVPLPNNPIDDSDLFSEMKIGVIVRTVFRNALEIGKVPKDVIEKMQDKAYSKEKFDIQYPILQKANIINGKKPNRYYAETVRIFDEDYFICSEWFEKPTNNDRPYLIKWLKDYL